MKTGSYLLAARPTVHNRRPVRPIPEAGFYLALLTKPPTGDGVHAQELDVPGYERQPIGFGPPSGIGDAVRQLSSCRVAFEGISDAAGDVGHAAVCGPDHTIFAYGIVERCGGVHAPDEIAFEAGTIQVKF